MIYLDNNATTKIAPEVFEAMKPYLEEEYGNPSSQYYTLASNAKDAVSKARKQVADLINASPEEIIFTSSGSESNNMLIKGIADYKYNYEKVGNHILTSKVEHDSVLKTMRFLNGEIYLNKEKRKSLKEEISKIDRGYKAELLDVDRYGRIKLDDLEESLTDKTILGSFIWANNETGNLNDMESISKIFNDRDIFIHSDGTQIVGRVPVDTREILLDSLTFSAHKLNGPKGIAALYLRKDGYVLPDLTSLIHGGDNQEFGYRAGTLAVHDIVGFGKAAELAKESLDTSKEKLLKLEKEFKKVLKEKYPEAIIITDETSIPGVVSFILPGVNNMLHIRRLSEKIALSSGSACSITDGSDSLRAMGYKEYERNFFRVSFGRYNTMEDIDIIKKYI